MNHGGRARWRAIVSTLVAPRWRTVGSSFDAATLARSASALKAQHEPGTDGRQAGDKRRRGRGHFVKSGSREVATCVGEIVQVVPPEQ
jgi:hypothetical protein